MNEIVNINKTNKERLVGSEREKWNNTISQVLKNDLWTARDMYDACHYLMLPLHFAFESDDQEYILQFSEMFTRFTDDVIKGEDTHDFNEAGILNKLHFLYLSTEFILLCEIYQYENLYSEELYEYICNFSEMVFRESKGPWSATKENGMEERITNILAEKEYAYSYYGMITDIDTFPLAILCDLKVISVLKNDSISYEMLTASELAYQIFSDEKIIVSTEDNGFIMQPGVYSTHPDALYAGNEIIEKDLQPKIKEDYVSDTSHFHRIPLFLNSFMLAQDDMESVELFENLKNQLANQLISHVLKKVEGKGWLLTTFMDGTNGVYRYSYNEEGVGHEGYSLSGTFLLGWWSFLDDERVVDIYQEVLGSFPFGNNDENPYFDYATTREQNFYFDADTAYENGYVEMLVIIAGK